MSPSRHIMTLRNLILKLISICTDKGITDSTSTEQWFSTWDRGPANFFYKTRARYNWRQRRVPGRGPAVEKHCYRGTYDASGPSGHWKRDAVFHVGAPKQARDSLVRGTKNITPISRVTFFFQFYFSFEVNLNTKIPACFLIVRGTLVLKLYRQVSPLQTLYLVNIVTKNSAESCIILKFIHATNLI
jgi:hypothetical protein